MASAQLPQMGQLRQGGAECGDVGGGNVVDEVSTDLIALLAQVQAYAAANGLSPAEVATRLLSLLSNNPPPDVADRGDPAAAPSPQAQPGRSTWLTMSHAKRAELREKNRSIVAEAAAVPDAEAISFWERKRAELAASVAEAQLPEVQATMLVELMMSAAGLIEPGWMP